MDPELQPIGWAMEEEMEDPGEEVLLVPGGIFVCNSFIFFLAGDVFFF